MSDKEEVIKLLALRIQKFEDEAKAAPLGPKVLALFASKSNIRTLQEIAQMTAKELEPALAKIAEPPQGAHCVVGCTHISSGNGMQSVFV